MKFWTWRLIESGRLSLSMEPVLTGRGAYRLPDMVEPLAVKNGIQLHFERLLVPPRVSGRPYQGQAGSDQSAVQRHQIQPSRGGDGHMHRAPHGPPAHQCARHGSRAWSPTRLAQLFQPFNRLGKEDRDEEGTGIGLVVSKRLVELMGGEIGVDSTVGSGQRVLD
jgi:hypothetical protein